MPKAEHDKNVTFVSIHLFLFDSSVTSQVPHNSTITRKQPAARAYSSLVVADCLHVRTCGIEAKAKNIFGVYTWHAEI